MGVSQANRSVREGREREGKVFNSFILLYFIEKLCFLGDISSRIKLWTKPPVSQTLHHTQLQWAVCFLGFQESLPFPDWEGCFFSNPTVCTPGWRYSWRYSQCASLLGMAAPWHCWTLGRCHKWPQKAREWTKAPSTCSTSLQRDMEGIIQMFWGSKVLTAKPGCVGKIKHSLCTTN